MKKQLKNFLTAFALIAVASLAIVTGTKAQGVTVKLGKSGCHFSASYSAPRDQASAAIVCDSVKVNSHRIVKRVMKRVFGIDIDGAEGQTILLNSSPAQKTIWLNMPNKQ